MKYSCTFKKTQCYDFLVYLKTYSAFLFLNHTVFTRKVVVKTPKYIIVYYYKTGIFATSIRWLYRITFLQSFKKTCNISTSKISTRFVHLKWRTNFYENVWRFCASVAITGENLTLRSKVPLFPKRTTFEWDDLAA